MTLQAGQRSTFNDVFDPENYFSVKMNAQGDGGDAGFTNQGVDLIAITSTSNTDPIVVTKVAHGKSDGDLVFISGITGNTNANGLRIVANKNDDDFELTDLLGVDVAGNGTHGGTGIFYTCVWYKVPTNTLALIAHMSITASDTIFSGDKYMAVSALPNGFRLDVYRGTTLLKELAPAHVHDFADWTDIHGFDITIAGGTGNSDAIGVARGALGSGLMKLNGDLGDSIILIQQDDLAGLLSHHASVGGLLETITPV